MSKFNPDANPKTDSTGLPVFRRLALQKKISVRSKGNQKKAWSMKTLAVILLLVGCTGFLWTNQSMGQSRTVSTKTGRIHYSTLYKTNAVATLHGQVVSVGKTMSNNNEAWCEYLTLKTSQGNIWVVLKPESYIPKKNLRIQPSDELEITGARTTLPGKAAVIAAQVKKGSETMVLRDVQTGRPVWAVGDDWHIH